MSNPVAEAILRLELMSRGKGDPVAVAEANREAEREFLAQEAWDEALPGGDGYMGVRGTVRYWEDKN